MEWKNGSWTGTEPPQWIETVASSPTWEGVSRSGRFRLEWADGPRFDLGIDLPRLLGRRDRDRAVLPPRHPPRRAPGGVRLRADDRALPDGTPAGNDAARVGDGRAAPSLHVRDGAAGGLAPTARERPQAHVRVPHGGRRGQRPGAPADLE